MKFNHKDGVRKKPGWKSHLLLALSLIMFCGGLYLLLLVMTPNIQPLYPVEKIDLATLGEPEGDRIVIPKVGINVEFRAGGEEVLNDYAWHRFPERGDPVEGGNFIISAHRFEIGLTPGETRKKSPFYHIEKLEVGDQVIIDYKDKRYGYEVTEKTRVKPNQVEIEAPSDQAKLTIYTCTLGGENDGREVFVAKPLGEIKDGAVNKT